MENALAITINIFQQLSLAEKEKSKLSEEKNDALKYVTSEIHKLSLKKSFKSIMEI